MLKFNLYWISDFLLFRAFGVFRGQVFKRRDLTKNHTEFTKQIRRNKHD
ncbi:hypothetical protein BH10ACI2_BH10ACI2_14160 [soil metagenome]